MTTPLLRCAPVTAACLTLVLAGCSAGQPAAPASGASPSEASPAATTSAATSSAATPTAAASPGCGSTRGFGFERSSNPAFFTATGSDAAKTTLVVPVPAASGWKAASPSSLQKVVPWATGLQGQEVTNADKNSSLLLVGSLHADDGFASLDAAATGAAGCYLRTAYPNVAAATPGPVSPRTVSAKSGAVQQARTVRARLVVQGKPVTVDVVVVTAEGDPATFPLVVADNAGDVPAIATALEASLTGMYTQTKG
ncbi:hypothetical protein [Nigerium sp.]|uniref:hypothetical protein n=1 Tax=Nigerium sp. TaxID=2042655 RepID=UPI003222020E